MRAGQKDFREFNNGLQGTMRQLDALRHAVSKKGQLDLPTYTKLQDLKEQIRFLSDTAQRSGGRSKSSGPRAGFPRAVASGHPPSWRKRILAAGENVRTSQPEHSYPPEVAQYFGSAVNSHAPLHLSGMTGSEGGRAKGAKSPCSQLIWLDVARPVLDLPPELLCDSEVSLDKVLAGGVAAEPSFGRRASPMSPLPPSTAKPTRSSRPASMAQTRPATSQDDYRSKCTSPGAGTDYTMSEGWRSATPGYTSPPPLHATYDGANRVGSPRAWPFTNTNGDQGRRSKTPNRMHRGGPRSARNHELLRKADKQAFNGGLIEPFLPNRGELLVEVVSLTVLQEAGLQPLRLEIRIPGCQSAPRRAPPVDGFSDEAPEPESAGSILLEVPDARTDNLMVTLLDGPDLNALRQSQAAGNRYGAYLSFGASEHDDFDSEPSVDPENALGCLRCPLAGLINSLGQCLDWTVDGLCTVRLRIVFFAEER